MRRRMVLICCVVTTIVVTSSPAQANESTAGPAPQTGFAAAVDVEAMTAQFHRLEAVAAAHPDGAGGTYFDEQTGQLVVRQVQNTEGDRLRSAVGSRSRQAGEVPVRFETTAVPIKRLEAAVARLESSRTWAGSHAASVDRVKLDRLAAQVVIHASGDADALVAAAVRATGVTPRVSISKAGITPASRRVDTAPYYGGLAMFNYNVTAAGGNPRTVDAYCTTGFRMTRGGTNSNWVTTAGHCGSNGTTFWHNGGWNLRVSSNYLSLGTDVSMVAGENGAYFSRYSWFGERDASTANPVTAKLTGWPAVGSAVYISGSNGGLVYGRVTDTGNTGCTGSPVVEVDTVTGHAQDGPVLGGDSGGPVTRWNSATSATNDLVAEGSITCSDRSSYAEFDPIHRIEAATGAVVVVAGT
ncbi:hypothetical protein F8271_07925 [Micromonospora sp. ALFpr18c]|uniref:hypothetical protein n=1 Tax=unclassified Micromonospora TaxID=2617518 RepID=UPI00124B6EDA|nr:hypothetical protein [Micromonospora sp. ALFpr18c]KAB1945576.1 hypothetical protein F8271_07925 [Micromonospora sp. ALFpr18c]